MKIVVVGAGAGGMASATRARRVNPNAEILILERSQEFSRGTCSLPYHLSGEMPDASFLQGISKAELGERKIELNLGVEALELQAHQRVLHTSGPRLHFDKLIVSTGSRAKALSLVGLDLSHPRLWKLKTLADLNHIKKTISTQCIRRVAVVGGGYVGIELAEALNKLGLQVTLFHRHSQLMRLTEHISRPVCQLLSKRGIQVSTNREVLSLQAEAEDSLALEVQTPDSRCLHRFDAVALALGIEPDNSLLTNAGATLGHTGAVSVNSRGETSLGSIYACGDAVEIPNLGGGPGRWVPLATTAARLGRVCGENAAGGSSRLGANLGALCVRLFDQQLGVVGQTRDWENCSSLDFEWGNESHPFPRRRGGRGVLFVEERSGKIRGLQALGYEASSLVDIISICGEREMTIEELEQQDFSYNPPLSGLWHPLYLAARKASRDKAGAWIR